MLRNVVAVTCAGRYTVWMAIATYNCDDVTREGLRATFLALVLAGTFIDHVNMAIRTHYCPVSIQTSLRRTWSGHDYANCSNSNHTRDEFPSRLVHTVSSSEVVWICIPCN